MNLAKDEFLYDGAVYKAREAQEIGRATGRREAMLVGHAIRPAGAVRPVNPGEPAAPPAPPAPHADLLSDLRIQLADARRKATAEKDRADRNWTVYANSEAECMRLRRENDDLRKWRQEQLEAIAEVDFQEVAKLLDVPLGDRIGPHIVSGIKRLKEAAQRVRPTPTLTGTAAFDLINAPDGDWWGRVRRLHEIGGKPLTEERIRMLAIGWLEAFEARRIADKWSARRRLFGRWLSVAAWAVPTAIGWAALFAYML